MRVFVKCAYNGLNFFGWQSQKDSENTVQGKIESVLGMLCQRDVQIVGCGRTDSTVHATDYIFHTDLLEDDLEINQLKYKLNKILPDEIVIKDIFAVNDDAHARFDAKRRSYEYHMNIVRDPFRLNTIYTYYAGKTLDITKLNEAAALLLHYDEFTPFCKTGSDEKNKKCTLYRSEWVKDGEEYIYHVTANRYLRGMIRLIVGMCINVARGKLDLHYVKDCLDNQTRLSIDWSVPGHGLFLTQIEYDDSINK